MNDKVTVVTVTYNAEDFLEETILSVINQSYDNIEYIIIDGASTDGTLDIIKKYEEHIDYWVSEADEGIYYAMNKAIEKATGKWINFMNAGDTFFELETVTQVMKYKKVDSELIYGDFQIKETKYIKKAWDQSQWYLHMPFCHQTLFAKTTIMKEELFDTGFRLAADHNFIVKMHTEKKKFNYIDKPLAIFTLGGFAESNEFLMNIESLKILLDHKVPQDEINQSDWYKVLSKNICLEKTNHIHDLQKELKREEESVKYLTILQEAIKNITHYSIWKQPLQKYKSYQSMLLTYRKVRKSLKGPDLENK